MLAQNFERAHKYDEAKKIYLDLLKVQPWNDKYFNALNSLYLSTKEYDQSILLIKKQIERNKNNVNFYALLGKTYYIKGNYEKAFNIWDSTLVTLPGNPINYRIIANAAIEVRAFDKAIEILKTAKTKFPASNMFLFDLPNLYTATMKYEEAFKEYCDILKTHPQYLQIVRARIAQALGSHGAAESAVKVLLNYFDETEEKVYLELLSNVYIQQKRFNDAFEITKKLEDDYNGKGTLMYGFAKVAYSENEVEIAAKAYEFILERFPDSPVINKVRLGYAKTLEKALVLKAKSTVATWKPINTSTKHDEFRSVIKSYRNVIKLSPSKEIVAEALYGIANVYKKYLLEPDSSRKYYVSCVKAFPLSNLAYNCKYNLAVLLIKEHMPEDAYNELAGILKSPRASKALKSKAQFLISKMNFWKGAYSNALEGLGEISKDLSDDNANDALQLSMMITTLKNDSLNLLKFARADKFLFQEELDSALVVYSELASNDKMLIWNTFAKYKQAEILIAQKKLAEAEILLKNISEDDKPSLVKDKALFLLGQLYQFGLFDNSKAISAYNKLLENFPNSLYLDKARKFINIIGNKGKE